MVYYRTYRPQSISELDSPKLRETLTSVLKGAVQNTDPAKPVEQADSLAAARSVPHAYLFTGPKGLGKTSTARIIAKVLNCTAKKRNGIEPCNECSQCVSITNGTNIDVLEIDGASNRGIDEIRELRERVNLAPSAAKKKVYIIDEVHMLTTEAFNALLKTIEEPPAHVVFIFATTEPQKVPNTIISRCFHVSLERATKEELVHALKRVAAGEKITVSDDTLTGVAEMADGGYRDATKMLEELVALSGGKKITKELLEATFHTTGMTLSVSNMLDYLAKKDVKKSLELIQELVRQGVDGKMFLFQLISTLHNLLLSSVGVELPSAGNNTSFSTEEINQLIDLFSKAYQDSKYAVIPSLPLELAIVQYCQKPSVILSDSEAPHQKSVHGEGSQSTSKPALPAGSDFSTLITSDNGRNTLKDARTKEQNLKVKQVLSGEKPAEKKPVESSATQTDLPKDVQDANLLLENLIYKVKPYNHSVAGVLRGCIIRALDTETITFQTKYVFHKEKLEEQKVRDILEKVVREVTGKQLRVMVELKTSS